jgi:hypothetical protein
MRRCCPISSSVTVEYDEKTPLPMPSSLPSSSSLNSLLRLLMRRCRSISSSVAVEFDERSEEGSFCFVFLLFFFWCDRIPVVAVEINVDVDVAVVFDERAASSLAAATASADSATADVATDDVDDDNDDDDVGALMILSASLRTKPPSSSS